MESDPSDENVTDHNKTRAEFTKEKLYQTRNRWHQTTASLNRETDSSKLWSLTKSLNEETPSLSKAVLHVNNQLLLENKEGAAKEFAEFHKTMKAL